MKIGLVQTVEREASEFTLKGIKIGDEEYNLCISQLYTTLELNFCNKEGDFKYKIRINGRDITFERYVTRPNHDHDDIETLAIKTDDNPGPEKGTIRWLENPHSLGWEPYCVEFGAVRVDY